MATIIEQPITLAYKLAIAVPGTLSFVLTIFTLSTVFFYSKTGTHSIRQKIFQNHNQSIIKVDWKIVALLLADLLQSCASQVSYFWIYFDISSITIKNNRILCVYQGIVLCIADLASAFCSTYICYAVMQGFWSSSKTKKRSWIEPLSLCLCFVVPIALTLSVFFIEPTKPGAPAFENNGNNGWCFMSPSQAGPRVWNHYFWVLVCILFNFAGYIFVITKITKMKRSNLVSSADRLIKLTRATKKLAMYPICFFILFTPIAIDRFLRYVGYPPPTAVTVTFFSMLMCNGIVNSCLCLSKIRAKVMFSHLNGSSSVVESGNYTSRKYSVADDRMYDRDGRRSFIFSNE